MDLGISDLARPSIDYVKYGFMVHAHRSDYEGVVGMMEMAFMVVGCGLIILWLVVGGEGDE